LSIYDLNQRLFSPQGVSSNPHHLNEMSWETYRRLAQRVFANTWFRGIPQRCLRRLRRAGRTTNEAESWSAYKIIVFRMTSSE
jgi:hypothetical protein